VIARFLTVAALKLDQIPGRPHQVRAWPGASIWIVSPRWGSSMPTSWLSRPRDGTLQSETDPMRIRSASPRLPASLAIQGSAAPGAGALPLPASGGFALGHDFDEGVEFCDFENVADVF